MGAVFAPTRFSLVRISVRDLVADGKSLLRNSGVGGGGENLILSYRHQTHPPPKNMKTQKQRCRERGKSRFSSCALVKAIFEALKCLYKNSVFEASQLVSTKTLLLKHSCRRQGDDSGSRFCVTFMCRSQLNPQQSSFSRS